jgi:hypothetical protein
MGNSHKKPVPRNYWANCNQTVVEWSLDGIRRAWLSDIILKGTHTGTITASFGLIWFSGFRGEDLNVIFYQYLPNLHNRYKWAERKILHKNTEIKPKLAVMVPVWVPFKMMSDSHALHPRWPPLLKIEVSSNGQNYFILSQNVPKFELYEYWKGTTQ